MLANSAYALLIGMVGGILFYIVPAGGGVPMLRFIRSPRLGIPKFLRYDRFVRVADYNPLAFLPAFRPSGYR